MKLSLATPQEVIFEGEAISVTAPGILGSFQILEHHAPLLTFLKPGTLSITTSDAILEYSISGGIFEIAHNQILILADSLSK